MKMTDESALAVVDALIQLMHRGEIGVRGAQEAREHIAARLEADQQKGGGEVVPWGYYTLRDGREEFYNLRNSTNFRRLTDMIQRGAKTLRDAFPDDAVLLYTTPQPSIPAPAQQVDDEAVAADNYRWLRCGGWEVLQDPKYWRPEYGFDGAIAAARADVATNAALAHPPHADQETQG